MRSHATRLAFGAVVATFLICLPLLVLYADAGYARISHGSKGYDHLKRTSNAVAKVQAWNRDLVFSPGHQNPVKAPPEPLPDDATEYPSKNSSTSSLTSRRLHTFERRDALLCNDGPCVDGSCCSKEGKCGYGPDYCGDGCQSDCDATAMCGEYSEDANMPCGMKLCCSAMGWCGTTEEYCHNADPRGNLPCQAGYGSCAIASSPSCGEGSGGTSGRTIGYYQSWNVRNRKCNKVSPKQLNTEGYTHLFYSFASMDPSSFKITPAHSDDVAMMKEFTSLSKGGKLQTWIAVGGFDFSDPTAPTHTTWSDMVSKKENRAAFISSVKDYMDEYGFQGVDLDWEYPGAPERGGRKLDDTKNFSLLLREMRAAYGSNYGISLTLAPDYWYLRWFDAKAMESSVDFFGFMAYDLHGSWDSDVKALGKKVRGQADIREISKNTVPLWFDGLDPKKINFGLAMYGRGYTLADPSCSDLLCAFSGPSNPAPCTDFEGVMSLVEIKQLIKDKGLTPKYLEDAMMKQITWDDQWIGYDDEETFAAKKSFADGLCFGGTMVWSIDFQVAGSGGPGEDGEDDEDYGEVVYLAPEVYEGEPAHCEPPCVFVFPPRPLDEQTTISIPAYTTSLEIVPGETTTIIVEVPAITTSSMDYYNVHVSSGQKTSSFEPFASLSVEPVVTTITGEDGTKQTRTLVLPPWPAITRGPPSNWGSDDPSQPGNPDPENPDPEDPSNPEEPNDPTKPSDPSLPTGDPDFPPDDPEDPDWPFPPIEDDIPDKTPFNPGQPPPTDPSETTATTDTPAGTWPDKFEIRPVETQVDDEGEDDDGDGPKHKTTCKLWFFFICIKWGDIEIGGLEWNLPKGTWGPGPIPTANIILPPGMTIKGTLPPWPKITVQANGEIEAPEEPEKCEPASASLCMTTSSFGTTVDGGVTKTTETKVASTCATITGCNVQDSEATETAKACDLQRRDSAAATDVPMIERRGVLTRRAAPNWGCEENGNDGIILTAHGESKSEQAKLRQLLDERDAALKDRGMNHGYTEIRAVIGFTAFYHVVNMGPLALQYFDSSEVPEAILAYRPIDTSASTKRDVDEVEDLAIDGSWNATTSETALDKRDLELESKGNWHLSQLSWPPGSPWDSADPSIGHAPTVQLIYGPEDEEDVKRGKFASYWDDSLGDGQTIYMMEAGWDPNSPEYADRADSPLQPGTWGPGFTPSAQNNRHGSLVGAFAVGKTVGVAKNALLVQVPRYDVSNRQAGKERVLEALCLISDDIVNRRRHRNTIVVNMSFAQSVGNVAFEHWGVLIRLMKYLVHKHGIVFVATAGNKGTIVDHYPAMALNENVKGMFVVGATNINGVEYSMSGEGPLVNIYAPGEGLPRPPHMAWDRAITGTSYAAPQIAGMVAYLRAHPQYTAGAAPEQVKEYMLSKLRRSLDYYDGAPRVAYLAWNGQNYDFDCSVKRGLVGRDGAESCPLPAPGGDGNGGGNGGNGGGNNGGNNNGGPRGPPITYSQGAPGPLCTADCIPGTLCEGYYCQPTPTGTPPDFASPKPTLPPGDGDDPPEQTTPRPPLPTLGPTSAAASPSGATCVSSTTWTLIGGPRGDAHIVTSECAKWQLPKPTTTTTPPKPSSPPKPPALDNGFIIVAFQEEALPLGSGNSWLREWLVFSSPVGGTVGLCKDYPVDRKTATDGTANKPAMPDVDMGPFEAEGKTCTYRGVSGKVGTLECDGIDKTECEEYSDPATCNWGNASVKPLLLCKF